MCWILVPAFKVDSNEHFKEVTLIIVIILFNALKKINSGEPVKLIFGTAVLKINSKNFIILDPIPSRLI